LTRTQFSIIIINVAFLAQFDLEVNAVILDLKPLLRGETDHIAIDYTLVPENIPGVEFGVASVVGEVKDSAGYIRLTLSASVDFKSECARCLTPIEDRFSIDFERTVADEKTLSAEALESDDGEYALMNEGMLDIDDELLEELLLSFPQKLLCSEDCPGLCPKCGALLKNGKCSCPENEPNPRWAALKNISFDD
jgi:uncharacterized protein